MGKATLVKSDLSKEEIKKLVDNLMDEADKPMADLIAADENIIINAAYNFLSVLNTEEKNLVNFKQRISDLQMRKKAIDKTLKGQNLSNFQKSEIRHRDSLYQQYSDQVTTMKKEIQTQLSVRNIYSAGLAFQEIANKAIGQEPKTIITSTGPTGQIKTYEIPLKEVLSEDLTTLEVGSKGGFGLRFQTSYNQLEKKAQDVKNAVQQISGQISNQKDLDSLNSVYEKVVYRFNTYKGINKKGKEVGIVLWKYEGWKKMTPSSLGDINEAYNDYFLNGMSEFGKISDNSERSIDIFMRLVAKIDNAKGRLIGDISVTQKDNTSIEYAIKSVNASLESYNQLKQMARVITGNIKTVNKTTITGKSVREKLRQLREIDNRIKATRNEIMDVLEDDIIKINDKNIKNVINIEDITLT